jgi:LysR family transcriptional regulator, hydrogen peroxide-inducible genes activator
VDTTQLRYFVAVVDCRSFSKAAVRCHTSQPNLSEQVRNLEDLLDITLVDRSGRQIVPTDAGRLLWERAKAILSQIDETKQVVRSIAAPNRERVTVGVMTTVASCFLAHVLNSFVRLYPNVQLEIYENITPELLPLIERGSLDLGIMGLPLRRKGFTAEPLFSEEMLLALHPKHPLTLKRAIFKEDIISEKLILSQAGLCMGNCPHRLCKRNNISPRIVFRSGQLDTIQSLVAAGNGISLIPQTAITETTVPITFRKVEDSELRRSIAVVTRNKRALKPPATDFLQHVRTAGQSFKLLTAKKENGALVFKATKG